MIIQIIIAIISLTVLILSANIFVKQASILAKKHNINEFVVGFAIISLGTSLPELIVSTYSTIQGQPNIAISNVLGSNIANICLVLGIAAIYRNFKIKKDDVFKNAPLNTISILIFILLLFIFKFHLPWYAGVILLTLFFTFTILTNKNNQTKTKETKEKVKILLLLISPVLLVLSGKFCVQSIINVSEILNINSSIISLFFVAIGTSLPELVTILVALKHGNKEMGIGSIIGSNMINLYLILGINTFVTSLNFSNYILDFLFLALVTALLSIFALLGKKYYFSKLEGIGLISMYLIFVALQIFLI